MVGRLMLLIPTLCSAGQFLDNPDIGNTSYLGARYLNHSTGRFITQDPMHQYNSHYIYGNGRAIVYSDPTGMMMEESGLISVGEERSSISTIPVKEDLSSISVKLDEAKVKGHELFVNDSTLLTSEASSLGIYVNYHKVKPIIDHEHLIEDDDKLAYKRITSGNHAQVVRKSRTPDVSDDERIRYNKMKSHELLSMGRSLYISNSRTIDDNYPRMTEAEKQTMSTRQANVDFQRYRAVREKVMNGTANSVDRSIISEYYNKLSFNTVANIVEIIRIGKLPMNKKSYSDMLSELIGYY